MKFLQPLVNAAWYATRRFRDRKAITTDAQASARLGWIDRSYPNWFQLGGTKPSGREAMASAAVYSCISILSQEVSRLDLHHWFLNDDRSRSLVKSSAPAVVLRKPNTYQSKSDWMMFMMQSLLLDGNAYSYAERDSRGAVSALHPVYPSSAQPMRVEGTYEIYYNIGTWYYMGQQLDRFVPQRDMLHLKLFTGTDPVIGLSPLQALGPAVSLGGNIQQQSASFFENMSRPAGILRTPKPLSTEAAKRLQEQWQEGMSGKFVGRTAVLDNDVDWKPLSMNAVDAEIIAQYKMSVETIAQVYRVPMFMLGDMTKMSFNNVESLQKAFIMSALGFYLQHIENALGDFFNLSPNEYVEFDLERGLLRPDFLQRMEGYVKGVQGGILTPDEPRARENLPPIPGGDRAYMQKQNVPLEMLGIDVALDVAQATNAQDSSSTDTPPSEEDNSSTGNEDDEATENDVRAMFHKMRSAA